MPYAPPKACLGLNCGKAHTNKGSYCNDCRPAAQTASNQARDNSVLPMYNSTAWRRFSPMMRRLNPICQRLELNRATGMIEQCRSAAQVVHHLVSPRSDAKLAFTASNVVCLCAAHHPNADGTPDWKVGVQYVATVLPRPLGVASC